MARKKQSNLFSDIEAYNKTVDTKTWNGTMKDYLEMVQQKPELAQLAHARVLNMIESAGVEYGDDDKNKASPHYKFFENDLFGIDDPIKKIVKYLKAAAAGSEVGKRIALMVGPTSSGKSQLATLIKRGLERYTKTEEGALYAISGCPMHENPLNAVPHDLRKKLREGYNIKIDSLADLCPVCKYRLENDYGGDWMKLGVERVFVSESGRLGIGTFVPGDQKCVTGDTMILSSQGLNYISDFCPSDIIEESDINLNVYTDTGVKNSNKIFKYKNSATYKIRTDYGYSITGTKNHPLMTMGQDGDFEWKNIENLKKGDYLVMSSGTGIDFDKCEMPENPLGIKEWTDNIAKFIGLYIAEGSIGKSGNYVEISNSNPNNQIIIKAALEELGIDERSYLYYESRNMICSMDLVQTFNAWGIKRLAHDKEIPSVAFRSGKLREVLLGMFLGDNNCVKHKVKNTNCVICEVSSAVLANQVHLLLLAMGIPSKKIYEPEIGTSGFYTITVSGERAEKVVRELNIPSWKYTRNSAVSKNSNVCERYRCGRNDKCKNSLNQFTVDDILEHNLRGPEEIVDDRYFCSKIKEISYAGKNDVYDIQVPEGHSFIANGIVSHNSQSITELVGGVDFSKLAELGKENHPLAFSFDGELNVASRGCCELIEMLKTDPKFFNTLLTLAQEKTIKTERFPLLYCDTLLLSHTNETEYDRFISDKKMEALHDRIIVIRVPYNLKLDEEIKIYNKLLAEADFGNIHVAPLTIKVASMFSVLSRLQVPKDQNLTLMGKMKLYNGEDVPGFTQEDARNIKEDSLNEGFDGISPRYVFNCISDCFVRDGRTCITPIDVLRSIKNNFDTNAKLSNEDIDRLDDILTMVVEEYSFMAKNEVQKAFFVSFEDELDALLKNYVDNASAHLDGATVKDEYDEHHEPNENLMRSVEEVIGISDTAKSSFRQEVVRKYFRAQAEGGFDLKSHSRLKEALEKQLFNERSDTIRLTVSSRNPDEKELQKLNKVINTLVEKHGYNVESANQLLKFVSSLFSKTS